MMIGGGGSNCPRADHGIGITGTNEASFILSNGDEYLMFSHNFHLHLPPLLTSFEPLEPPLLRACLEMSKVCASNQCLRSCTVQYGGQYKSTDGFRQAECSGNIQSANKIGFWCDWIGDGSVMMIGGGGSACKRTDHGIGIKEANVASFVLKGEDNESEYFFGLALIK
ncbi:hypothetical protein ACROYT_G031408 [Oculina patagonica]